MIRVILVDDQALVRSGVRAILESEDDIEIVAEAGDGATAIELAAEHSPDVMCMDIEMPGTDGIQASREILGANPKIGILVLTTFGHERYLFEALSAGVSGFLLKTARAEQFVDAVREIAAGGAVLGPDVTHAVIAQLAVRDQGQAAPDVAAATAGGAGGAGGASTSGDSPVAAAAAEPSKAQGSSALERAMLAAGLTDREQETLRLIAEGLANSEIATRLFVGESTVKTHVSNVLQKLGMRDRVQAIVWALTQD